MPKDNRGGHIKGFREERSKGQGLVLQVRRAMDISQATLAQRLGMSAKTISQLELTGKVPSNQSRREQLFLLARQNGIDTDKYKYIKNGRIVEK